MKYLNGFVTVVGLALTLNGCGHKDTDSVQSETRGDQRPLLQGTWNSKCEGSKTNRVMIETDRLTIERVTYYDAECQEKIQTVRLTGPYELAHTFKSGVLDSIVFTPDNDLKVTINNDYDVEQQNNMLANLRNEKSAQTTPTMTPPQKKQLARENVKLFEAQRLTLWKTNEEKSLNRFQLEKLQSYGLGAPAPVSLDTRTHLKYEVDNGFLLLNGGSDFAHVFSK